ncbi:MAG TPA: ribonuclease D [Woeseiaceae bacterium]|nr:ribonuclease D [Woeseiaceae bacterium]
MPSYTYVDQPARIIPAIETPDSIGVDTEFMREKTFYAELCLLQVSAGDDIFCVDPLGGHDMAAFWQSLSARTWVVHSARQDIEVIYQTAGTMPQQLFDTQIAAALLGYQPQLGYAALVEDLFDVSLPKAHTRANWAKRPIPDKFLDYAAEDVEYLLPAQQLLAERLAEKGRYDWALADSALMLDPALHTNDPATAVLRVKAAKNFRGARRRVAARLAAWRETAAMQRNLPRQWIIRDNVLADIAYRMPASSGALAEIDGLPPKTARLIAADILKEIELGQTAQSAEEDPAAGCTSVPDEQQKSVLQRMQKLVAECAGDLGLAAETIASRKELAAVVVDGRRESRVFSGWRQELVGEQLAALL